MVSILSKGGGVAKSDGWVNGWGALCEAGHRHLGWRSLLLEEIRSLVEPAQILVVLLHSIAE